MSSCKKCKHDENEHNVNGVCFFEITTKSQTPIACSCMRFKK